MSNKFRYKKVSIIIPVYNESNTIEKIIKRVKNSNSLGMKKEIIIVDDGSTDDTPNIINKLKDKEIKIFFLRNNSGKGTALRKGFKEATGDIIIVQDADLEYNPKDFPIILIPLINGDAKVVYGSRELSGKNKHSSIFFHAGGKLVTMATNLLFTSNLTDEATGYKVFDARFLKKLPLKCQRFEFCPEVTAMTLLKKERIIEVPISYKARHRGEGKKIKVIDGLMAIWTLLKIRFN